MVALLHPVSSIILDWAPRPDSPRAAIHSRRNQLIGPVGTPRLAMFDIYEPCCPRSAANVRTPPLDCKFVMCEQTLMERTPGTMELADKAGISKSYASEIVNGKRPPSRPLAIHIMRATGWRHTMLDGLSDEQIAMLETVEPWTPRPDAQAAA